MRIHFIILAAGQGTRMQSNLPKVLHKIAGRTLLEHVLHATNGVADETATRRIVLSATGSQIQDSLASEAPGFSLTFSIQDEQLGTGHAVACAFRDMERDVKPEDLVLVLFGDTPLLRDENLKNVIKHLKTHPDVAMTVVGMTPPDPKSYGRICTHKDGHVSEIVEFKNASPEQKAISYCNSGIMGFRAQTLVEHLGHLSKNDLTGEYYLTDLVALTSQAGQKVTTVEIPYTDVEGVNNRVDLSACEALFQERKRTEMMTRGVTLQDPTSVYFSADTHIEQDVIIEPHVVFGPGVSIESGTTVRAFSHIEGATIGQNCAVGPFARLRAGTDLDEDVKVGNFVETKKTTLKAGAKASHLSYIGDAIVGEKANIGAGTITCNYDGFEKHTTTIGAGAFIGSNTCLVAPVTVGENALVAAGSTVTKNVSKGALALSRHPQKELSDKSPFKNNQNKVA